MPSRKPSRTSAPGTSSLLVGKHWVEPVGVPFEVGKKYPKVMLEMAVSPTTHHFENARKSMLEGITRRFTLTSLRNKNPE